MKKILGLLMVVLLLTVFVGCEKEDEDYTPEAKKVILSSNKDEIRADNTDEATFTVTVKDQKGNEMTDVSSTIYSGEEELEGTTFKTDTTGEYRFKAKAKGIESTEETITAIEPVSTIEISADKTEIVADGEDAATWTVTLKDANDEVVNYDSLKCYVNDIEQTENRLATTESGIYTVKAEVLGKSEQITIEAKNVIQSLELTAKEDKFFERVNLTVTGKDQNGNDMEINDEDYIIYKDGEDFTGSYLEKEIEGTYVFKAEVGEIESKEVTVTLTKKVSEKKYEV